MPFLPSNAAVNRCRLSWRILALLFVGLMSATWLGAQPYNTGGSQLPSYTGLAGNGMGSMGSPQYAGIQVGWSGGITNVGLGATLTFYPNFQFTGGQWSSYVRYIQYSIDGGARQNVFWNPGGAWGGWAREVGEWRIFSFSISAQAGSHTVVVYGANGYGSEASVTFNYSGPANTAPSISASATSIYCGQASTVSWNASDVDGNFSYVQVWMTQNGSPTWDYLGSSSSASGTMSWSSSANFNSANPANGAYLFVVRAVDTVGSYTDAYPNFNITNRAPTAGMSIKGATSGSVSANMGETLSITVWGNDDDSNLRAVNLWVLTPNVGWRNIRSDSSVNSGFIENSTTDNAVNSGGANTSGLGGVTRTFTVPLSDGFGTYTFVTRSIDAYGGTSVSQQVAVGVSNRLPFLPSMTASPSSINFGQSSTITSTATDADGNLYFHGLLVLNAAGNDWNRGSMTDHSTGWGNHPVTADITSASYSSGAASGASSTKWIVHRPSWVGTITYHANTNDGLSWASDNAANWSASAGYTTVVVNKTTPTGTFADRSFATTRTLTAADLNATFANPYSGAVAAPSGTITYSHPAGTVLYPGTYTVTATYPGDGNYNSTTKSATFTVTNTLPTVTISAAPSTINFGQSTTVTASGSDVNGNLYLVAFMASTNMGGSYERPGTVDYSRIGWNGYPVGSGWSGHTFTNDVASGYGPLTKSASFQPLSVQNWNFLGYSGDAIGNTGAWSGTLTVNKATPTGSYSGGTRTAQSGISYTVQAADLISTFANPYSGSVAAPTGSITYAISPASANGTPGSTVTAGSTIFAAGLPYTVRATYAGNGNYNSSTVDATFTVNKVAQAALSMTATPSSVPYGTTSTLSTTGGSGTGAVTYSCTAGGSIAGNVFTPTAASGTVTVTATKAADVNYNATTATTVITLSKGTQSTVSVSSSASATYGTTYTAAATGGNGTGAYVWSLGTGSTAVGASINSSSGVITANSIGTVVVNAYRAADTNYNQSSVSADFSINVRTRSITVTLAGSKPYDISTTPMGATASITSGSLASGDSISYAFADTSSASVGSYTGLTTATISNSAAPSTRTPNYLITYAGSYSIGQSPQTITFGALAAKVFGDAPFAVSATSDSGLPVSFSIASGPATISGATVTITGAGTVTVRASQAGNSSYSAALNVDRSFTVAQAPQVVTIDPSSQTVYTTQTVLFTASGGQNGYNWGGTAGASGSGTTKSVSFNSNGSYTVTIQSPAGGNYAASNVATATIQVNPAFILTLTADAGGSVTGAGLYPSGVNATPGAVANAGYIFAGWYGSDAASMANSYDPNGSIMMSSNKSLTARFVATASAQTLGAIDFGPASIPTGIGTHSAIRDAIMANTGNSGLELRSLAIVSGNADFSAPVAGGIIAAGSNISTPVTFKPTGATIGTRTGRVVIVTTDANYPLIAYNLSGTASTGAEPPIVTLSITSLATIFPDDNIALNVYTEVNFGNVSFFTWRLVTPSGATAPASISGPSPTLSGSIPYTPTELGAYQFQVTATNDSGQSTSAVLDFTVVQGLFTRTINARAEPSGSLNIWFTPSTTNSKAVDVWKAR